MKQSLNPQSSNTKKIFFFLAVLFFLGFEHILKSDESKLTVKIFMGYHQY